MVNRSLALLPPEERACPEYAAGVRSATKAALDYAFAVLEAPSGGVITTPPELLGQARLAASCGIPLESVLRRYSAGFHTFVDFLLSYGMADPQRWMQHVHCLLRAQAGHFDSLLRQVSEEYQGEAAKRQTLPDQRRMKQVRALLDGDLIDPSNLPYRFECWHLGFVCTAPSPRIFTRNIARGLGRAVLTIPGQEQAWWGWLGGEKLSPAELQSALRGVEGTFRRVAVGEPAFGLSGWRLTHRQARAAYSVMQGTVSLYSEQALLASMAQDELLGTSLRMIYLAPLEVERDGGRKLKDTLTAYFIAREQVSSAAAELRVSRKTVSNRLCRVEQHLQRPIASCAAELKAALALEASSAARRLQTE